MQSDSPARPAKTDRRPTFGGPSWSRAALLITPLTLAVACSPQSTSANGGEGGPSDTDGAAAEAPFRGLERASASKVLVAPLEQREMVRAISTTVNAESETEIEVFPRTSGVVVALHVEEGDRVDMNACLLEMDPRDAQAALDEANIALREAQDAKRNLQLTLDEANAQVTSADLTHKQSQRELKRKEEAGAGIIARNELDQLRLTVATNDAALNGANIAADKAEAALETQDIAIERAQLQVSRAELDLSYTRVEAPFAGVIARRDARVGDLVSNAAAAFVLTDPENVRAVVSRPQRELTFFREAEARARKTSDAGAERGEALDIEIEPEALPGAKYAGRIRFVSPTIDPASGQFRVTIGVEQPEAGDERLPVLPGMLLRIRIVTERHPDALVVPKRALLREGESYFVFTAKDGVAHRHRVLEGFASDDHVEVLPVEAGALTPDDPIVVVGNRDLEDGDRVESSPWGADTAPDTDGEADASADDDDA